MRHLQPPDTRPSSRPTQVHKDLCTSPFVFVRVDGVRKPLQPPYEGPYKVLERRDKFFVLDRNGRRDSVSIDRLKVAFVDTTDSSTCSFPSVSPTPPSSPPTPPATHPPPSEPPLTAPKKRTRFGRLPTTPPRLTDYVP